MPYLNFDTSLDFDAQEQEMLQAAARIKALRSMKVEDPAQTEGFTSAVTGAKFLAPTTKKPLLSTLAPAIADYTAGRQEAELNTQRSNVSRAQQEALMKWMEGAPQATSEQVPLDPSQPTGAFTGTPDEIIAAINNIGDPTERARALQGYSNQQRGNMRTVTTPPTRDAVLGHAAAGMNNPLSRTLAGQYLSDQLIKEPERDEARAAREHEKALARAEAQRKQADDLAYKKANDEANRLNRIDTANIMANRSSASAANAAEGTWHASPQPGPDGKYFLFNSKNPDDRRPLAEKTVVQKPLPVETGKAWRDNNTNLARVDDALAKLETPEGKNAIGNKGYLGNIPGVGQDALNALYPEGVDLRAIISDIGTLEVHDRSGATVTASEYPRLKPFIPLVTDSPDVAAKKLRNFKAKYSEIQREILNYAEDMGYKMPTARDGEPSAAKMPQVGEVRGGYRFKGGDPNSKASWEPAK